MKIHDDARSGNIAGIAAELAAGVAIDCLESTSRQSALHCVSAMPDARQDVIEFLVKQGAAVSAPVFDAALQTGSLDTIKFLINSGATIDGSQNGACGSLTIAAYGRGHAGNQTLIPVLTLLIEHGADVNIVSKYSESALRVLSCRGRFDAVEFLLGHGADEKTLAWTDLIRAVALGTYEEFEALLLQCTNLEQRDYWERTPWLVSLLAGDLNKAQRLLTAGAQINEVGRCGQIPMMYAIEGNHIHVLEWLITLGIDLNATDEFGQTALLTATELGRLQCASRLLNAGADRTKSSSNGERPITTVCDIQMLKLLTEAGEDPSQISNEMHHILTGAVPGDPRTTNEEYSKGKHREFGQANPQRMDNAFWNAMIQCGCRAYHPRFMFNDEDESGPVWCYYRYGRTTTILPDGRIVEIAGEHADYYDPDFCIYNDVTVFDGKGNFEIWGYPEHVFPPTDFHSATLIGDHIYIIGSLGYQEQRRPGETPVYRLDCRTFTMECIKTSGEMPGWISSHTARFSSGANCIYVTGGKIYREGLAPNHAAFALDLRTYQWSRVS